MAINHKVKSVNNKSDYIGFDPKNIMQSAMAAFYNLLM